MMDLESGVLLRPEDRNGVANGRMNPMYIIRWTKCGPCHYYLSFDDLEAKTSSDQEALLPHINSKPIRNLMLILTSLSSSRSSTTPSLLTRWFLLDGKNEEYCMVL